MDPIVKMLDSDGNVKETLSIKKWNTDTVEEFFETHLEKVSSDDNLKTNKVWIYWRKITSIGQPM